VLTVGLRGALSASRGALERSHPKTEVTWTDLAALDHDQPVDLVLQLADDATASATVVNEALVATWERVPEPHAVDRMLQQALVDTYGFIVGYTDGMHRVCRLIQMLAHPMTQNMDVRALIVGESGAGKDLVARAVHRLGRRADRPFVAINCAALPRELILSELFGNVRGAFSGAVSNRSGLLREAADGVLFLDEIAELPVELQTVLLRVLEERVFRPLGSTGLVEFGAQVISATNQVAATLVERGAMRADLYFRLAHIVVPVPPLAERDGDLELLVGYLWRRVDGSDPPDELIAEVAGRAWPGNVRQLRHVIEYAALLRRAGAGSVIEALGARPATEVRGPRTSAPEGPFGTLAEQRERFERDVLVSVLRRCAGDLDEVARELGITRRSVYNLLKRHRIAPSK